MEEPILQALEALASESNGAEVLIIAFISAYFESDRAIDVNMFLLFNNAEFLKAAIQLLEQHRLIEFHGSDPSKFRIDKKTQEIIRALLRDGGLEKDHLKRAARLMAFHVSKKRFSPNSLDHAMSVLKFASKHKELVEDFPGLPSQVVTRLMEVNRLEEAFEFCQATLPFLKITVGECHDATLSLQHNLATLLGMKGKHVKSKKTLDSLHLKDAKHSGTEEIDHTLTTKARELCELSDYENALKIYQTLLEGKKVSETYDEATLTAWHDYALLLNDMGKYSEALDILQDVLDQRKEFSNADDDDVAQIKCSIAIVFLAQEKYNQALKYFNECLYQRIESLGELHPDTLRTRREIALVLRGKGMYEEALEILEDVEKKFKNVFDESHADILATRANIGAILIDLNDFDKALEICEDVHQKYERTLGATHNEALRIKNNIATILIGQNKFNEANKVLLEMFKGFRQVFGPNHPSTIEAKTRLKELWITTVHAAAETGDLSRIMECLNQGVDVNEEDYEGRSPLHYAAKKGHFEVVKYLLNKGASHNVVDFEGKTPLSLASGSETKQLLILVSKAFEDVKAGTLNVAHLVNGQREILNAKDKNGFSLLHWAVCHDHKVIVKNLIDAGCDLKCVSLKGNTPLHVAVSKSNKDIAEILLKSVNGNELSDFINAQTTNGKTTALHVAAEKGDLKMIKCLLKYGASFDVKNKDNDMPVNLSRVPPVRRFLYLLQELFCGVEGGSSETLTSLQSLESDEFSAVIHARNSQNRTLLQVAIANRSENIANVIVNMIQDPNRLIEDE